MEIATDGVILMLLCYKSIDIYFLYLLSQHLFTFDPLTCVTLAYM